MAFKCWMVIVQISWGYARELWGLKAPMDLFIGWGMNPGCTWGQNSGVPVKHMVHYGPCLVTGYRRLFLFFFSFYFCQPLFFILNNDIVTLGLSSVISSPAAYRQFTAVHCRFWRRHFYFSCFCFFSLLPHLSHHLHGHWDLWISKVGPLSKRSLQHHNRIRELTL